MTRHGRIFIFFLAICVACKPTPTQPATSTQPAGPLVRATIVTIRTTMQPEARVQTRALLIAGNLARDTGERDTWRLFDTQANTVTFIDDIERTVRTESLKSLLTQRRTVTAAALPAHYPRVRVERPGTKRLLLGVNAESLVIESGAYQRELWFGEHAGIPRELFSMMHASEPPTKPLAPMMRAADEALLAARGFPLADHAEVPLANEKVIVDRVVAGITTRDVPQNLFAIPKGYRDLTASAPPRPTS
jgi:hypothetical protein